MKKGTKRIFRKLLDDLCLGQDTFDKLRLFGKRENSESVKLA